MKRKTRILIADDHPLLREAMRNVFEKEDDIEVVGEASDGEQAVKLCSDLKPDIAIMDIVMPNLNGIEASKEIKRLNPGTAILILTAHDDPHYVLGLLEAGASGYLLKSARGSDVVDAIRAVRNGEAVLHPSIIAMLLKRAMRMTKEHSGPKEGEELTEREMEVLGLAARGMSNKEIAQKLSMSVRTVKAHVSNIFSKMNVASRTEAIFKALQDGSLALDKTADSTDIQ